MANIEEKIKLGDVRYLVIIDHETQEPFMTRCVATGYTPGKQRVFLTLTETLSQTARSYQRNELPPKTEDEAIAKFLAWLYGQYNSTKRTTTEKYRIAKAAIRLLDLELITESAEEPEVYDWI